MRYITIEITDETYDKVQKLASVVDYLVKEDSELSPEDMVYAALYYYLERFYPNHIIPQNKDLLFNLSLNYPLRNRIREVFASHNMTLSSISKQAKIPKTTLVNILNNNNQPTMDVFLRLYPLMGYPHLHQIFYRELPE